MATLSSFSQVGGAVGDDFGDYEILEVINAGAGQYVWVTKAGTAGTTRETEIITLTAAHITAKAVDTTGTPGGTPNLVVHVSVGGTATVGDGVTLAGQTIGWTGLDLDGRLAAGMRLIVEFNV